MQYSGLQVFSFVVLLVGTAAIIASIATTHWTSHNVGTDVASLSVGYTEYRGLWESCTTWFKSKTKHCNNRFEDVVDLDDKSLDYKKIDMAAWEIAVLALMCGSALLGVLSLIMSPCCCNKCGGCLTLFVLLATLCCAGGVGVFAYYKEKGKTSTIDIAGELKVDVTIPIDSDYGWSFWLAVGGGACQLLATICFGLARGRQHSYSQNI